MLTLRPDERTWSTPPKPMSYAQPSPPMIQTPWRTRSPASASRCRASVRAGPSIRPSASRRRSTRSRWATISASVSCGAVQEPAREVVADLRREALEQAARLVRLGVEREAHPEAELGVVLEQRVAPGRAAAGGVHGPRRRRQVGAVDRRAAGRVGHDHPIAEELADEPDVRRLAAAAAGTRELEERLEHLRALDRVVGQQARGRVGGIDWKKSQRSRSTSRCSATGSMLMALWLESVLLLAGQTSTHTPHPVQSSGATWIVRRWSGRSRDRNSLCRKSAGAASSDGRREDLHPDRRVRADHRALAAVDADGRIPDRDHLGDRPLLVRRGAGRERAVDRQRAHRQQVAVAGHQSRRDPGHEVGHVVGRPAWSVGCSFVTPPERHVAEALERRSMAAKLRATTASPRLA